MSRTVLPVVAAFCLLLQACGNDGTDTATTATNAAVAPSAGNLADRASPALDPTSTMFQTLDGKALELKAFAGSKVFLNYWATWCAPCIREIPSITRAAAILEPEGYVFLLASDESLEKIHEFLIDREFSGNFIKLNGFFGGHGIDAVPSSLLYDEKGALIRTWPGEFEWDSPEMIDALRE